jgi:hypothetical protein
MDGLKPKVIDPSGCLSSPEKDSLSSSNDPRSRGQSGVSEELLSPTMTM